MSEFLVGALKIGFLILLWLFVLLAANTIRTDLFGRAVSASDLPSKRQLEKRGGQRRSSPSRKPKAPTALAITQGRQEGLRLPLDQEIVIGRHHHSTLVLDDDYVSNRHATVASDGTGGFYVDDHGSTNGTYINDVRITAPTAFGAEDTLRIGRTLMKLVA